jgi:hypothetical protein
MSTQTTSGGMSKSYSYTTPNPEAFITQQKQRIKQFENSVYLKDNSEYEVELFNPFQTRILAKIKIDGNYISGGGIVLRPVERIFLERFIDTNNKFVYRTYTVQSNNTLVDEAIKNNGNIEIEFYHEDIIQYYSYTKYIPSDIWNIPYTGIPNNIMYTAQSTGTHVDSNVLSYTNSNLKETGVTEKGAQSNQNFENVNINFNSFSFHTIFWKILPLSEKKYTTKELNVLYCGSCGGKRRKTSFKYCPYCGSEY